VQAELEKLLILQDRDQKIRQIGFEIKTLPQQRKNLEAQLAATAASLESSKQHFPAEDAAVRDAQERRVSGDGP